MENNRSRENPQANPSYSNPFSRLVARLNQARPPTSTSRLNGVQRRVRRNADSGMENKSVLLSDQSTGIWSQDIQPLYHDFIEFFNESVSEKETGSNNR